MRQLLAVLVLVTLAVATVNALLHVLGVGGRDSSWRPIGEVLLLCVVWLLANSPFEGGVLLEPLEDHGLTVADLAVLPPLAVVGLLVLQRMG